MTQNENTILIEGEYKFEKNFIKQLFEDKLVFILNGKNKIDEWKLRFKELNMTKEEIESEDWNEENKGPILKKEVDRIYTYIQVFFQELLKVNNFSFLVGAGCSIPFGSKSVRNIEDLEFDLESPEIRELYDKLKQLFIDISEQKDFESFLSFLFTLKSVYRYKDKALEFKIENLDKLGILIKELKKIFITNYCNPPYPDFIIESYADLKESNKVYSVHQEFLRKILARPYPLRRPNIFTLNYDLMFEKAMDKMGIIYIDGFIGTTERSFRPESYTFDFYYPATTTEGKVSRLDKVIHLYKLHGSIDWVKVPRTPSNIFGIAKKDPDYQENYGDVLIYPTPMKEGETLGFPYSELIRRFASIIQQPQSVLITIGYSFNDEHINRIIWEALSIPSFNLVIVAYSKNGIEKIKEKFTSSDEVLDTRITFIAGEPFGDFRNFTQKLLPDISQLKIEEHIKKILERLFQEDKNILSRENENER